MGECRFEMLIKVLHGLGAGKRSVPVQAGDFIAESGPKNFIGDDLYSHGQIQRTVGLTSWYIHMVVTPLQFVVLQTPGFPAKQQTYLLLLCSRG